MFGRSREKVRLIAAHEDPKRLILVAYLHWFEAELAELQACSAVSVSIHITGRTPSEGSSLQSTFKQTENTDPEKRVSHVKASPATSSRSSAAEKPISFEYGRPDVEAIVDRAVAAVPSTKRVLVAGKSSSTIIVRSC